MHKADTQHNTQLKAAEFSLARTGNAERWEAGPEVPEVAKCPHCGYTITPRGRKQFGQNGDKTWFYRYKQGFPQDLSAAQRIAGAVIAHCTRGNRRCGEL